MIQDRMHIQRIPGGVGRKFLRENHYSRGCHNGPRTWGIFAGNYMIGAIAFATPNSENVRSAPFGEENKHRVTELHRLFIFDGTPKNTESWFISKSLKLLAKEDPRLWGVLSYSDQTEGHLGTVYQATNALYLGSVNNGRRFYRDETGALRHPRQCGVNITVEEALRRGWTVERRMAKHRYLFLVGSRTQQQLTRKALRIPVLPYPKAVAI